MLIRIDALVPCRAIQGTTGRWVGICDPLNITVEGDTWTEMKALTAEAIDLLLADLLETGELDRFLRDQGWTPSHPPVAADEPRFDLPFTYLEPDGNPARAGA